MRFNGPNTAAAARRSSSSISAVTSNFIGCLAVVLMLTGRSQCSSERYNQIEPEQVLASRHDGEISGEKRSWQNLQGSWGKRDFPANDDDDYEMSMLTGATVTDSDPDYDDLFNMHKFAANYLRHQQTSPAAQSSPIASPDSQQFSKSEQKRSWKSMSGAWGKRLGSGDWNRFRGSWGKREPGWNNLKGLWGKRAATANNWNKLQSAWGKRESY